MFEFLKYNALQIKSNSMIKEGILFTSIRHLLSLFSFGWLIIMIILSSSGELWLLLDTWPHKNPFHIKVTTNMTFDVKTYACPHLSSCHPQDLSCAEAPGCVCRHRLGRSARRVDPTWTVVLSGCKRKRDHLLSIRHTWSEREEESLIFFLCHSEVIKSEWI